MTEAQQFNHRVRTEWLQVKQLSVIWIQAQRPLRERDAQVIAANFDPDMFGELVVTLPNGKGIYHIIDGQHRKRGVEILWGPDERVPCKVVDAADPARAAEIWAQINGNRRNPSPVERFLVMVTAKDETCVNVNKIVLGNGYYVSSAKTEKSISCVQALVGVYTSNGATVLDQTLKIILATWGRDPNAVIAPLIRGYAELIAEYGRRIDWKRLRERIAKQFTPGQLMGSARTGREMDGGSISQAVRKLLITHYNRGLRAASHLRGKSREASDNTEAGDGASVH